MRRPVVLAVLDGWGIRPESNGNAIALARTPNLDSYLASRPHSQLGASGPDVGLIAGQMGNSNVGHLNLGAGRVVYQDLGRITKAVQTGAFSANEALRAAMTRLTDGKALHLMGLLSDGGVHSHEEHVFALLRLAKEVGVERLFFHLFLDGRDVPPRSAEVFIARLERQIAAAGIGRIATVQGRFYAMDRDQRWERVERAYGALVCGRGEPAASAAEVVSRAYARDESDEFVQPAVIIDADGRPVGPIAPGDSVIFWNFRADRAREIIHALTDPEFTAFGRCLWPVIHCVTMTMYEAGLHVSAISFPPEPPLQNILGEWLSAYGARQLRIAETEKYAHVTYFFDGGREDPYPGEERVLIPSPKVATYDATPAMSAPEVTAELLKRLENGTCDSVVLNYANCDMVGHTGVLTAAISAVESVDECLGRVVAKVRDLGGAVLIVSDHGNAEEMIEPDGKPHTAHTCNPVPCILIDDQRRAASLRDGILADVAPTLLDLLELPIPPEMTGRSLLGGAS